MSILHLRIKIKSLAAEARIIRHDELKYKNRWRRNALSLREAEVSQDRDRADLIQSGIVRDRDAFGSLRNHRTGDVRHEARSALLALGYLRGRPYESIESKAFEKPDTRRIAELVVKFGPITLLSRTDVEEKIKAWIEQTNETKQAA